LLAIQLGSREAAEIAYPILEPWRGRSASSVVSFNGLVTELLGLLALTMGDLDRAERDLDEAIEQAGAQAIPVPLTCARLGRARLLSARGYHAAALAEATAVETDARAIGMTVIAGAAHDLAESCRVARVVDGKEART
jgi:hypothetical protein